MDDFQTWLSDIVVPGFYRKKWGRRFWQTIGRTFDLVILATKYAVKARFPSQCPDDALDYCADARNFDRYRVETSNDAFRAALQDVRRQWTTAGTKGDPDTGLINKFYRLGYNPSAPSPGPFTVNIYGWYEANAFVPGIANASQTAPYAGWWSAFFVVIHPNPFAKRHWGDGGLKWGQKVSSPMRNPDDIITWGSSANHSDVAELRRAIHKWKAAHEICSHVIFRASSGTDVFDAANVYIGTR